MAAGSPEVRNSALASFGVLIYQEKGNVLQQYFFRQTANLQTNKQQISQQHIFTAAAVDLQQYCFIQQIVSSQDPSTSFDFVLLELH